MILTKANVQLFSALLSVFQGSELPRRLACKDELDSLSRATHQSAALEQSRRYLQCTVREESHHPELQQHMQRALAQNPYEAVKGDQISAHFFDSERLQALPPSPAELDGYIQLLEDQGLARAALGQADVAEAARLRAQKLRAIAQILDDLGEQ